MTRRSVSSWTEVELEALRLAFNSDKTIGAIAEHFGRSPTAVWAMASELKLVRNVRHAPTGRSG